MKGMVEVFKTDVNDPSQAKLLMEVLHGYANSYQVNFDLEDRDRILRIQSHVGSVNVDFVIRLLREFGVAAEVLPD